MFGDQREIIAERLGWPDGAVQACRDLEARWPEWQVYYNTGGLPSQIEPAYVAHFAHPWHAYKPRLTGATPKELSAAIEAEEKVRPAPPW